MNIQQNDQSRANGATPPVQPTEQYISAEQGTQNGSGQNQGVAFPVGAGSDLPIDPQQPLREYASSLPWTPPGTGIPQAAHPGHPGAGVYQPAYTPQPGMPQPGATYPPSYPGIGTYQPGYPAPPITTPLPPHVSYPPPAYPGYGAAYGYPGTSAYAYPGYGYYPWQAALPQPKRDTYLLVVGIIAFACSCLTMLGGLFSLAIALLVSVIPNTRVTPDQAFSGITLFLALAIVGLVGGGFCTYHSVRSLFLKKPSRSIWIPSFWIFLLGYLVLLGLGFWSTLPGQGSISPTAKGVLVYLSGLLPALAILALGMRRLRFSARNQWSAFWHWITGRQTASAARVTREGEWPTSWRRMVLALVSGATLSVTLAIILEFVLLLLLVGSQGANAVQSLNDPNVNPDPAFYGIILISLAVVAPIVEELVKPLAVLLLIGRVRNKAEAFALGLACGIGFNLIETTGYISSDPNWLNVALIRSGAGLLHGFGAAMMALGWYILTHKEEGRWRRRLLLGAGCGLYAMVQHAIWNGSWGLALLPGPVGDFFQNWSMTIGAITIDAPELVNIIEMLGILIFFIFIAGRLRIRSSNADQPVGEGQALTG